MYVCPIIIFLLCPFNAYAQIVTIKLPSEKEEKGKKDKVDLDPLKEVVFYKKDTMEEHKLPTPYPFNVVREEKVYLLHSNARVQLIMHSIYMATFRHQNWWYLKLLLSMSLEYTTPHLLQTNKMIKMA